MIEIGPELGKVLGMAAFVFGMAAVMWALNR